MTILYADLRAKTEAGEISLTRAFRIQAVREAAIQQAAERSLAEFEAPETDPAESDPAEAEQATPFYTKAKVHGMWQAPDYFRTYEEALAAIDADRWPAVVGSISGGVIARNMSAIAAGVKLDSADLPSSAFCPLHGADCEAWA